MYITHRRYKGKSMTGKEVNIPACTRLEGNEGIILFNGEPLCFPTSQVSHEYISRNDDGNGLERGKLTYAIAFGKRERVSNDGIRRQRFTDEEIELLCDKWSKYLIPDVNTILFNHDFFNANVLELRQMAYELKMEGGK